MSIRQFLEMTRGQHAETVRVDGREIAAGGAAHLVAYVGHNGLMDFAVPELRPGSGNASPRVAVVLACYSDDYFSKLLRPHAAPLVMTDSLMAPEAYVLEAVVTGWFAGASPSRGGRRRRRSAYARYQKISGPLGAKDFPPQSLIIRRPAPPRRPIRSSMTAEIQQQSFVLFEVY